MKFPKSQIWPLKKRYYPNFLTVKKNTNFKFGQNKKGYCFILRVHQNIFCLMASKVLIISTSIPKNGEIFTKYTPKLGIYITVAEKHSIRQLLANRIAFDAIFIMLVTYPFVGLLIWFIVGQGLKSVKRVTDEVSHRIPSYLEPVDAKSVPPEIKPLVVELNKLFLRLQQAIDREKRFAGDAAHELRTPLAGLKTQAQVALKTKVDRERKQLLHNVITGVDRCTHVVQQLLTLSRLAPESKILGEASRIDLPKLTAEVLAQLAPMAIEKKLILNY
jgi:two-component system, OmpR family, sensor histidine kinase QseC